jgi:5-methylcytosine-specific restriction protein A
MTFRELVLKPVTRSRGWSRVRREHLRWHPRCAVCGRESGLEVHHIKDVSNNPELELEPGNLVTLCSGSTKCHFVFGHLGSWKSINPDVMTDAAVYCMKMRNRR